MAGAKLSLGGIKDRMELVAGVLSALMKGNKGIHSFVGALHVRTQIQHPLQGTTIRRCMIAIRPYMVGISEVLVPN